MPRDDAQVAYGGDLVEPDRRRGSTVDYYLGILRRRLWIIVAVLVVVTTFGVVKAFKVPKIYEAVAKILVERHTKSLMDFKGVVEAYSGWDPDYYTTQSALLRSRVVMEKALEEPEIRDMFLGGPEKPAEDPKRSLWQEIRQSWRALMGTPPAPPPEPWERLRGYVRANMARDTHFIEVSVRSGEAAKAAAIANASARAFVKYHQEQQVQALGDAFAYLQREKKKEEEALRQAEDELQAFRQSAKFVAFSGDTEYLPAQERLTQLHGRLTGVKLERTGLLAEIEVMKDLAKQSEQQIVEEERFFSVPVLKDDPTLTAIRNELAEAQKQSLVLADTYGPEHPQLAAFKQKLEMLRAQFREAMQHAIEANTSRVKVLEREEAELSALLEREQAQTLGLAREAFTLTHLRSAVERHRKLYEALVQRMLEVDISSGFSQTTVEVVEKADVPVVPINPKRPRKLLMSLAAGLLLGVALAFVVENLDDSVKTPEDLRDRLDIPLLGFVPVVPMRKKPADEDDFRFRGAISLFEPVSSVAEAYRNIRTSILYSVPAERTHVLSVVSCSPREGKSTTASNLALVMAQSGKRVLLMDADLHRPVVHKIFDLKADTGLTTTLTGQCEWPEALCRVSHNGQYVPNLDVMPAGPSSPNPAELLSSERMREVLESSRRVYDWVFIDTPPILFVSDSSIVSAVCDGAIFVVKAGAGHRSLLARARDQLENVQVKMVGAVLNSMAVRRVGRYYSDYYYHGYARYSRDYKETYYADRDKSPRGSGRGVRVGSRSAAAGSGLSEVAPAPHHG